MAIVGSRSAVSSAGDIQLAYPLQSWCVVLVAALFFFFEFIQMNMFNAIDPSLIQAFKITDTALGNLSAMYFYGNVAFLFPAGMILDRLSTKRCLLLAMLVSVICTFLFALTTQLWQAELCRFFTGMASAFCMLSAVRLTSRWFKPARMALVIGLVVTFAMLGGMLAQTPMTLLVQAVGWHHAVLFNSSLGVVFWFLILFIVKDFPKGSENRNKAEHDMLEAMGFWRSIWLAICNKQNWLAGIYTNFVSFPVVILGASWGSLYLTHVRGLTQVQSTYVTTMIFLGMILGSPFVGWLSDQWGYRKRPMLVGGVVCLGLIILIMLLPQLSLGMLMVLFFLLGFSSGAQVITYPLVVESNARSITTTAEGLSCTLIMTAGLFQMVYGWLVDLNWQGQMADGVRVYSAHAYQVAMVMFPVTLVLALIAASFLKETRCQDLARGK